MAISVVRQHIKEIMTKNKEWTSEQKAENIIQLSVFDPKKSTDLLAKHNIDASKFEFVFNTIYKNLDRLSVSISKDLPADIYENNEAEVIQCMIENAILGFYKNPFILSSMNEDVLNSLCVMAGFNLDEDNPYVPHSAKHQCFKEVYFPVFTAITESISKTPIIGDKSKIEAELKNITEELMLSHELRKLDKIDSAIINLQKFNLNFPIEQLVIVQWH